MALENKYFSSDILTKKENYSLSQWEAVILMYMPIGKDIEYVLERGLARKWD